MQSGVHCTFMQIQNLSDFNNRQVLKIAEDHHDALSFIQLVQFAPNDGFPFVLDDILLRRGLPLLRLFEQRGEGYAESLKKISFSQVAPAPVQGDLK